MKKRQFLQFCRQRHGLGVTIWWAVCANTQLMLQVFFPVGQFLQCTTIRVCAVDVLFVKATHVDSVLEIFSAA